MRGLSEGFLVIEDDVALYGRYAFLPSKSYQGRTHRLAIGPNQIGNFLVREAKVQESFAGLCRAWELIGEAQKQPRKSFWNGQEKDVLHSIED